MYESMPSFYIRAEDLNSGVHACIASTLQVDPTLSSHVHLFYHLLREQYFLPGSRDLCLRATVLMFLSSCWDCRTSFAYLPQLVWHSTCLVPENYKQTRLLFLKNISTKCCNSLGWLELLSKFVCCSPYIFLSILMILLW